jgi:penicillin-binding protein 1A
VAITGIDHTDGAEPSHGRHKTGLAKGEYLPSDPIAYDAVMQFGRFMLTVLRYSTRILELLFVLPYRVVRALTIGVAFNPSLGPLRYVAAAVMVYVVFAVTLVYGIAPVRGYIGGAYMSEKLRYDAERWLATSIYDTNKEFVGTFDPRLDSVRDVNFTSVPIKVGNYFANPDHKSIPVLEVPEHYWQCLVFHEDRHIGSYLNPFGIDLLGVLKIPYSTISRSVSSGRIRFGVGGSTLPMQLARVIYKTPPRRGESVGEKIGRKLGEWWVAPVIYRELTRDGDNLALKQWASNHLWLAQRTGGQPLHGVEVTSRIVFGKTAAALSIAQQFVLASAVNKPIILLEGSERLNHVRLDRWKYITEVRARYCAERLIKDPQVQRDVIFELVNMAGGPPDPRIEPKLEASLKKYVPDMADRARANPIIRANVSMPSARFGLREEMKQVFGYNWRRHVRGITTTLDVGDNLAFKREVLADLKQINKRWGTRLNPGYTLDPDRARSDVDRQMPHVIVAAADRNGRLVRYYESSQLAPYFGSAIARKHKSGSYIRALEPRQIASTGKMLAAIAIANQGRDGVDANYIDSQAPKLGLETCRRGGTLRRGRRALVAFACSLNGPVEWRAAQAGQRQIGHLIEQFGFNMPPAINAASATPPSTAAVRGLVSGAPRQVHQMSAAILAALTGRGHLVVEAPTLVAKYDFTSKENREAFEERERHRIVPNKLIRPEARGMIKRLLQAPLCYQSNGRSHGTLKALKDWCAPRRKGLSLHIAKTGTAVTANQHATIDGWVTGGLKFSNGAAYSYVVVVGTGSAAQPFASRLHSSQLAVPLVRSLLESLEEHARQHPVIRKKRPAIPVASAARGARNVARRAEARKKSNQFAVDFFQQLTTN